MPLDFHKAMATVPSLCSIEECSEQCHRAFGRSNAIRFIIPGLFYFKGSQRGLLISGKEVSTKWFPDWVWSIKRVDWDNGY